MRRNKSRADIKNDSELKPYNNSNDNLSEDSLLVPTNNMQNGKIVDTIQKIVIIKPPAVVTRDTVELKNNKTSKNQKKR